MKELQERQEGVDKRDLQIAKKRKHQFEISLRINFWDYVALDRQEKGRGWESLGGKWVGNIHRVADYQRLGEYSVWMSLVT